MRFPRQDIPSIEKTPEWYRSALNYAQQSLTSYQPTIDRMSRLYATYNGTRKSDGYKWVTHTYGKENRTPYVEYRLGKTKIDLLVGEMLKRPLSATVQTVNSSAQSEKMRQYNFMKGAMAAKQELEEVRDKVGIDVMNGVPIPSGEDDPIFLKMNFKDKSEDVMQIILNEQIKSLQLKKLNADMFRDVLITSMCWVKSELDEKGDVKVYRIDPREAIYELIEGDDYFERSTVKGARQMMSVEEILRRYNLTKAQTDQLDAIRGNFDYWYNKYPNNFRMENGQLFCSVVHIEWKGVNIDYWKTFKAKDSGVVTQDVSNGITIQLDASGYEKDKSKYDKKEAKGDFKITKDYREEWYEATCIGAIIDVNCRAKPFQTRDMDNPAYVLNCSYSGYSYNMVDRTRVSIQQTIENFDNLFDIVMYQINRELARAKGKVMWIDRAMLNGGQKIEQIVHRMVNDQILDINSAADGNVGGRNVNDPKNSIGEFDLGVSSSFPYLMTMQQNIINMVNQITGINEAREGNIAASSTASNANSAMQNSRTITEPIFYGMNVFMQKFLESLVNLSAISWAFYKTEKGEQILGSEKYSFLKVTQEEGYKNYGVHIEDGTEYMETKQIMKEMISYSLNAKEIRPVDAYKALSAQTMAEMNQFLEQSWTDMESARQQQAQQQQQSQQQMAESQQRNQYQISKESIEDTQANEKDNIILGGKVQMEVDNNNARNKMYDTNLSGQQALINNQA